MFLILAGKTVFVIDKLFVKNKKNKTKNKLGLLLLEFFFLSFFFFTLTLSPQDFLSIYIFTLMQ